MINIFYFSFEINIIWKQQKKKLDISSYYCTAIHIYQKKVCVTTGAALNIAYARNITKRATLANNYKSCIGI